MGLSKTIRLAVPVAAGLVLAACITISPSLQTTPSVVASGERRPLSVAVVVPDAARGFNKAHEIQGACFSGGAGFAPAPYGQQLAATVEDRFKRLFETVTVIDASAPRDRYDALFEIGITDVGFQFGCLMAPQQMGQVTGSFRAIDPDGREMWRSQTTVGSETVPFTMIFDPNSVVGGAISQAAGKLADSWAREVGGLDVAQYAAGGSKLIRSARRAPARAGGGRTHFSRGKLRLDFPQAPEHPDDVAVIIGNANYGQFNSDIPNVDPAYADTEAVMQYAVQALGIREGNVIYLQDATGAQMTRIFGSDKDFRGQLFDWVRPGRSRVFVYYSGHGAPAGADGSPYLVPADADASRIELNGYPLATLYRNLAQLGARETTVVIEACFSGVSQAGTVLPRASGIYVKPREASVPPALTVIAAGQSDQVASWEEDKSNGLFTKYYLTGMAGEADRGRYGNGDGRVELSELKAYLRDTMTYYARRYYGRDQTPEIVVGGRVMN